MWHNSVIDLIGNTPIIKLNKLSKDIKGTVLVKVEYFNPGHSVKDRIAIKMVEDAEKAGLLKPGGTIIECTSGNTGMGLALVAAQKGYKCIFTMADKQSKEKVDALRAVGAEVHVCPTNVEPTDPRSYYSVAAKLHREIPNSFHPNQYDNLSNSAAHYETTGPEIWQQTEGKITHYAGGLGTGGTVCGTAKYLKEQNKNIQVIGIDTYGSLLKKLKDTNIFDENEVYPYLVEGIGEDFLPKNIDFNVVDHVIKVTDKDAAIMARRLAREESLLIGWSCGAAVFGALEYAKQHLKEDDVMVIILPDHGTRYMGKIYNDTWMKDHGYLEAREFGTAKDIILSKNGSSNLTTIPTSLSVGEAVKILNKEGISQIPVVDNGHFVGSLNDSTVLNQLIDNPDIKGMPVGEIMEKPFIFVGMDSTLDALSSMIGKENKALLVRDDHNKVHIITQSDILVALAK